MVELPSFSAMAFKASITVIAVVYAVQMLCGASENNENSSATTADGPQDDCDSSATTEDDTEVDYAALGSCMYDVLHIANNKSLAINCTLTCGITLNDTMPCVNATNPPLNFTLHWNYTCIVGYCWNGTCPSNNTNVSCWADVYNSNEEQPSERAYSVKLY
uniref:Evasin n=1 Tax=Rhipicephalus appendiculatus TaxID=34631 RepID=A0A131YS46_RHIAP